jgi:Family of unknown function (DUF5908)
MPIEIKELNIKINVSEGQSKASDESEQGKKGAQSDIVAQCVEHVLEILSKTHER